MTTSEAPTIRRPGRRLVAPAALDDAGTGRQLTRSAAPSVGPGGLEPELERLHRREVAQAQVGGRGGEPPLDRVVGGGAGAVGDGEERRQRRQPDELGLGEVDAVLGRDVADGLPDQPERRRREVEQVHRHLGAGPSSSIQKPLRLDLRQAAARLADPAGDPLGELDVIANRG